MSYVGLGLVVAVVVMFLYALGSEGRVCLAEGPERIIYFTKIGSAWIPIYDRDCLEWEGEK